MNMYYGIDLDNNWEPTEGQHVSILIDMHEFGIKKGTVKKVFKSQTCRCGRHHADLNIKTPKPKDTCSCFKCGTLLTTGIFYADTCILAPIQPMYENISKQIAESITQTDEVPDRVVVPQTVNN